MIELQKVLRIILVILLIEKTYMQETVQYLQSVIKIQVNRSFIWSNLEVKMEKLRKIGEINGWGQTDVVEIVKALEKQGFIVVDDNEDNDSCKTWHVMVKV